MSEPKKPQSVATLFDLTEELSPRAQWCRRRSILASRPSYAPPGMPWEARVSFPSEHKEGSDEWMIDWALHARSNKARFGHTQDDALDRLAKALGIESYQAERLRQLRESCAPKPQPAEFEDGW